MKEIWQKIHSNYSEQDWINKPSIFAEQVISHFPQTGSILELGGALGQDSAFFKSKGYDVLLTDLSEDVIKVAKEKYDLNVQQVDIAKPLPFADNSFDVVYAHLSLHFFDTQKTKEVFDEIYRVLKSGGVLAALFNSTSDPECGTGEKIEGGYFEIRGMKKRFFDIETLSEYVEQFEVLSIDSEGETYKDNAKGVKNLIRLIGKKN